MQKVITINLNGNAYQLDESGYETLRAYLSRAAQALSLNPDHAEIMADLEQAIGDKCQRYLGPHKTVVTSAEVDAIVAEMGPVVGATDEAGESATSTHDATDEKAQSTTAPRRLYRIPDGAMIGGVCTGLAAFIHRDVTLIRVGIVIAALITKGVGILAYVVMMFVVPEATTPEARAAASGDPLNAKDVVDRATEQYKEGRKEWRRRWRHQRRQWQQYRWRPGATAYAPPPWTAVLLPVLGLAQVALFVAMAAMMVSLVNTRAIRDWRLPPDVPLWAGVLVLLVAHQVVASPLRASQRWHSMPRAGAEPSWFAFWNAVTWLLGGAILIWFASNHTPEVQEFLQRFPELVRDFAFAVRAAFTPDGAR